MQIEKVLIQNASLLIPINEEMYLVGHVVGSFVAWPQSLVLMDGGQQPRKMLQKGEKKKRPGKQVSQEHEPSLASSNSIVIQQSNEASIVPTSLSRLLTIVMEKDDSFILAVFADLSLYGLSSHEIIVAKEDVEFMTNFKNITTARISLYIRYNVGENGFLWT